MIRKIIEVVLVLLGLGAFGLLGSAMDSIRGDIAPFGLIVIPIIGILLIGSAVVLWVTG